MDTSGTPPAYECLLRGANMSGAGKDYLDALEVGSAFTLHRDRDNAYDNYAVKVRGGPDNLFVGFLHRDTAMWVGQWIDAGWSFKCTMIEKDDVSKKREHLLRVEPTERDFADVEPVDPSIPEAPFSAAERFAAVDEDDIPF